MLNIAQLGFMTVDEMLMIYFSMSVYIIVYIYIYTCLCM